MAEAFTLVGGKEHHETVFSDLEDHLSGKSASLTVILLASIRAHHPTMTVSITTVENVDLLAFAAAGYATASLDTSTDWTLRLRVFRPPTSHDDSGHMIDSTTFARYTYVWKGLTFIIYLAYYSYNTTYQFICFPPDSDEDTQSNSKATDALLLDAGSAIYGPYQDYIAVFDNGWRADVKLYREVQKTGWDDVILDANMKKTIMSTIEEFFDNESRYRDFDVPWKRGIIFHGPPGNGKTLSLRALMHSLSTRASSRSPPIALLYVKSMPYEYAIRQVFQYARTVSPCLLIFEDIDTQIEPSMMSYFFNEVDGLENNDGILMVATTNHLDKIDEGLKRPSRFDRRYLFPLPAAEERRLYSEFWRKKLANRGAKVEFPEKLSEKIAGITDGFSFAVLKEAFIATLLALARKRDDDDGGDVEIGGHSHGGVECEAKGGENDNDDGDIEKLPLWKEMKIQVKLIRKEMDNKTKQMDQASYTLTPITPSSSLAPPPPQYLDDRTSSWSTQEDDQKPRMYSWTPKHEQHIHYSVPRPGRPRKQGFPPHADLKMRSEPLAMNMVPGLGSTPVTLPFRGLGRTTSIRSGLQYADDV